MAYRLSKYSGNLQWQNEKIYNFSLSSSSSSSNAAFQQKLVGEGTNGRIAGDQFGESIAIDGDTCVIGTIRQDFDAAGANELADAGAVYIYTRSGSTWTLQQKLVGEGTNGRIAGDRFGNSVAIDGDTCIVGAELQDFDAAGANELSTAGAAYVYTRSGSTWSLQQKLVGEGTNGRVAGDQFGNSVAIDGDTCIVGAPAQSFDAAGANELNAAGAAYVFTRSGSTWTLQQKLVGEGTNGRNTFDFYGFSVGVSSDTCIVGAYFQDYDAAGANNVANAGAAYVYTRSGSTWTLQQKLVGEGTNGRVAQDKFGVSVAIDGDTCIAGVNSQSFDAAGANELTAAGAAFVFTRSGSTWSLQQKLVGEGTNGRNASDFLGESVSVDGDTCVIGAYGHGYDADGANLVVGAGAAFVFARSGSTWSLQQKLVGEGTNSRITGDRFGFSVGVSSDTFAIGTPLQGFDENGANDLGSVGAASIFQ